jgi:hypothetical protein
MSAIGRPSGSKNAVRGSDNRQFRSLNLSLNFVGTYREKPLQGNDFDRCGDFAAW